MLEWEKFNKKNEKVIGYLTLNYDTLFEDALANMEYDINYGLWIEKMPQYANKCYLQNYKCTVGANTGEVLIMVIERNSCPMEHAVKPLLESAATETWRDVLNILYFSGHVVSFENLQLPCLVSAQGHFNEIQPAADLLRGRAEVALTPLVKDLVRVFLPKILFVLRKGEVVSATEEKKQEMINMMMISEFKPEKLEKHERDLTRIMIRGATTLSDLLAIEVFQSLLEIRSGLIRSASDEDEYEDMIEGLRKLGLVESRLQVSLCPECTNYQFIISRNPSPIETCPKCGTEWATAIFYNIQPPYNEIKKDNSDLPLFISSYLKHKIYSEAPIREVDVLPKAVIRSEEGNTFDVDVFIPEFAVGVECKVFEDPFAPMTQARLGSIVGTLEPQIRSYFGIGIKDLTVVTNLPNSSKDKLKTALKNKLKVGGFDQALEVLPRDIDILLQWLDEQALKIAKHIQDSFKAPERTPAQEVKKD